MSKRGPRVDFGPAPVGYVAGMGRGATGFTTRSDIGSAAPTTTQLPSAIAGAGRGRNLSLLKGRSIAQNAAIQLQIREAARKEVDLSDANYDAFAGYGGSLFDSSTPYEQDDLEADQIYEAIDKRIDEKRKHHREKRQAEELENFRKKNPRIEDQFADVKEQISQMSADQWLNIPEPQDISRRNKRTNQRQDLITPVPDSIIQSNQRSMQMSGFVDPMTGLQTPALSGLADLTTIGKARDQVLSVRLDRASDSVTGQTVVDPTGYLTDMNSVKVASSSDVSDIKKARLLLNSVITTNPKHAPGWIAAARLEEAAGKQSVALSLITKGCDNCPDNEDVWLEAARLHSGVNAKAILAKAVRHIPFSVKIWSKAASLESDVEKKRAVLRKALENIPQNVSLWKELIELEEPDDAKILLRQAVKCVPHSTEMWLALASLESYDNAKIAINRARTHNPTDVAVWIAAAQLEESQNHLDMVDILIKKAVKSLAAQRVVIDREQWLKEAQKCEKDGYPLSCHAIVKWTIGIGVEDQDRKYTWRADASSLISQGHIECARAVYEQILSHFSSKPEFWLEAAQLEKQHGTSHSLESLLSKAVQECPQSEKLWLMGANEKYLAGDINGARMILEGAFTNNPNSENIWLAAVKIEFEGGEYELARLVLERARAGANSPRIWMRSAQLERELGNLQAAIEFLEKGLDIFPQHDKMWMMLIQGLASQNEYEKAVEAYQKGLKKCAKSANLWICAAKFESEMGTAAKARALLEKARLRLPANELLYLHAIEVEKRCDNGKAASMLLAKGLQECPKSGILWACAIEMEPRPKRKGKSDDAVKNCGYDAHVCLTIARWLWSERKPEEAANWFERSIAANPKLGDSWAHYFKFLEEYGVDEQPNLIKRCEDAAPCYGRLWISVSKAVGNWKLSKKEILLQTAARATFLL
jgi:pre-mRNA-processing factor 6